MLIRELAAALGWQATPPFDPRRHADRYRAQPRDRRRIVNVLYRAGGTLPLDEVLSQPGSTADAVGALEEAGLLWRCGKNVVLPLEHLFATPLLENETDTLVESLKIFPKEALWAVAGHCGVDVDGADEFTVRARLFRMASLRRNTALNAEQKGILRRLEQQGWSESYQSLGSWIGQPWLSARSSVEALLTEGPKPLRELALKLLLIPERLVPGSQVFAQLTVPRELRTSLAAAQEDPAACSAAPPPVLRAEDGRLRGDLLRYLLLIEQDPPAITQKGGVNMRDLGRLAKRAGVPPGALDRINMAACQLRLVSVREGRAVIDPWAEELYSGGSATFTRRILEARQKLWMGHGSHWMQGQEIPAKISDLVMKLLLKNPSAVLCLHCLELELRDLKDIRKLLPYESERKLMTAVALQAHASLLLQAGALAVGIENNERITHVRWTSAGLEASEPAAPVKVECPHTLVQPTGEIIAPGELPLKDLRAIAVWAEVRSVDAVVVFALTRASVLRAAQRGEDPAQFRSLLEKRTGRPLPQPVAFQFEELASRMGEVEVLPCSALIRVKHPHLLEGMEGVQRISDTLALVPASWKTGALLEKLRKQGMLIAVPKAVPGSPHRLELERFLRQAAEQEELVTVILSGGRQHDLQIYSIREGVLQGADASNYRRVSISLDSILEAYPSEVDAPF